MDKFIPLADVESVLAILAKISLFGGTTDDQLKSVLCRLQVGLVKQGDYVFCEGDDPLYIYIVKRGKLDLILCDGDVRIGVHELGVGECFGEASMISMHKHTASAIAKEDSEIMVLSRHALIDLRHENIQLFALLMMNIARELARRLQSTDALLLHYLKTNGAEHAGTSP